MMNDDWKNTVGFTEHENWGNSKLIMSDLVKALVKLRKYVGKSILIHCGTQGTHCKGSFHGLGMAVDLHISGMNIIDQFIAASRFPEFTGIGIYPNWNNPGLHLDIRQTSFRALWWRDSEGKYQEVDALSIKSWRI